VMLISTGGTVIRMPVDGIRRAGRSTQGVIVMRLREGETVSALAPVVEAEEQPNGAENGAENGHVGPEGAVLDQAEVSDNGTPDDDE